MSTLHVALVIAALVSAIVGVMGWQLKPGTDGKARFTPNWVALALAFWFASLLAR